MKSFNQLSEQEINNCICGTGITANLVKKIVVESKSLVKDNFIDTELFSAVYTNHLSQIVPESQRSNADWACGYVTADNLNELMNRRVDHEN